VTQITVGEWRAELDASREPIYTIGPSCTVWLRGYLADGPKPHSQIVEASLRNGFSRDNLRHSKTRGGVRSRKVGFGPDSHWEWYIAEPIPIRAIHSSHVVRTSPPSRRSRGMMSWMALAVGTWLLRLASK
jgi:hypothetical protein